MRAELVVRGRPRNRGNLEARRCAFLVGCLDTGEALAANGGQRGAVGDDKLHLLGDPRRHLLGDH